MTSMRSKVTEIERLAVENAFSFQRWLVKDRPLRCLGQANELLVIERMLPFLPAPSVDDASPVMDGASIAKDLCAVFGHMVLSEGMVLGDPHPGNMMLLPNAQVGLIDFGGVSFEPHLAYT